MSEYVTRNDVTENLPGRIGRLGPHKPYWESTDCPSCGSAPCGPHPDILGCAYCAEDWPCAPVDAAALALEILAEDPDPVARVGRALLLERAALLRGDVVSGDSPPWPGFDETTMGKLRAARRLNAVAATVADAYGHLIESLTAGAVPGATMPVGMMLDMLHGVVAALGGEVDPDKLMLHPDFNATHRATLAHLLEAPLEGRTHWPVTYVETTTANFRTRHYSRPEDLRPHPETPGHHGDSLCHVNSIGGVVDQVRADYWAEKVSGGRRGAPAIHRLPLCGRCARIAARPAPEEKP